MKTLLSEFPKGTTGADSLTALWRNAETPKRHEATHPSAEGPWKNSKAKLFENLGSGSLCVLTGKRGTGKTQLGIEMIRCFCWSGYTARYTKAMDVFLAIREGMAEKSERAAVKPYLATDLLVIDAMEERGETPWEDRMLNFILDKRYDAMMDTILITNQDRTRFSESVGASIVSRIHESGIVIECDWESFRVKAE